MEIKNLKHLSTLDFPLRWVDMDSYRHVSQTRYFDAMTEARAQWLHFVRDETAQGCLFYVIETSCDFYISFKYPGTMRIKQYVREVKGYSFTLEYHIFAVGDERCRAKGVVRLACVSATTEKPVRVPVCLKKAFM
jgi:acyl-CoA thioester hydrolase